MSNFTVGGGGTYLAAKSLPNGTKVQIISVEPKESKIQRQDDGEKSYQVCVVFRTLDSGETVAYEKGRAGAKVPVPKQKFEAGQHFTHYFGGIFTRPDGSWKVTEKGGTYQFLAALKDLGVPLTGKFDDYAGAIITLERVAGMGAQGRYWTPMPIEFHGFATAEPAPTTPGAAPVPASPAPPAPKKPLFPAKKPQPPQDVPTGAFATLSAEDQSSVMEYIRDCGGPGLVDNDSLVGVVCDDLETASAIIASAPPLNSPLGQRLLRGA